MYDYEVLCVEMLILLFRYFEIPNIKLKKYRMQSEYSSNLNGIITNAGLIIKNK